MKIAHSTLAALIVFTCAAPSQQAGSAQGTNPTFSLSISAAQEVVKSGSAVTVQVVLTNISDHKIGFPWLLGHPAWNYELNVRDGEGNPAVADFVDVAVEGGEADAEMIGIGLAQFRDVIGDVARGFR